MVDRIEALVDAFGAANGMNNPESEAYRIRSPLLLRSFAKPGRHTLDEKGRRVFESLLAGYKASVYDCLLKVSGQSRAGLRPEDTITNLCGVYGLKEKGGVDKICSFLRRALSDQSISAKTPLSYFLSKTEGTE